MNIYDIAKLANVSIATVSRVVNNSPKVSPKTKEKVLAVMKENAVSYTHLTLPTKRWIMSDSFCLRK